jgi:hypothetical protein
MEGKMLRTLKVILSVLLLLVVSYQGAKAQKTDFYDDAPANTLFEIPPRDLIDAPTAGTLPRGCFDIVMRVYNEGGILGKTSIGLSNRLTLGMSYGASGIIADHGTTRNPRIEFNIKLRLINEEYLMPAFAIGFVSQGFGTYLDSLDRYTFKSKGFFGVISRSFFWRSWAFGGHIGINYSLEADVDDDAEPTLYFGLDARFSYDIGLIAEYDLGLNDDRRSEKYAHGRGYLNLGVKWLYSENLELEVILKDLLRNRRSDDVTSFGRELRFTYLRPSADEERGTVDNNYNQQYGYSHYYYPGYWSHSQRWGRYYAVPWWWDYYGFDNSYYYNDDDNYVPPHSTGGGRATPRTRFREVPPPTSGSGGSYNGGSSTGSAEKKQPADNSNTAVKQKKSDPEQKKSKPTRTGGGRKKR